jgi:hypothetical protein
MSELKQLDFEWLMMRDRLYFERHPNETSYIREYIPGEIYPSEQETGIHIFNEPEYILVTNIKTGLRRRDPLWRKDLDRQMRRRIDRYKKSHGVV